MGRGGHRDRRVGLDELTGLDAPFEDRALGHRLAGGRSDDIDQPYARGVLLRGRRRAFGAVAVAHAAGLGRGGSDLPGPLVAVFGVVGLAVSACGGCARAIGSSDGDARDHLSDGDGVALLDEHLGDRAAGGRGQLHVDLVGGDLDDRRRRP